MQKVRDLRNSEIKDIERCPIRWHWGWNDQLTSLRQNTKLWMGIGFHEALALWYQEGKKRGPHPAETWQQFCKDSADVDRSVAVPIEGMDDEIAWQDAVDLGTYVLENYVRVFGEDGHMHFIATERTFNMPILTPKEHLERIKRKHIVRLVGTWDGVYLDESTGEVWLIEHKSSAVGGVGRWLKMIPIDKQTNTYYMSATYILRKEGLLKPNQNIAGIMFNFLEKYKPTEASEQRTRDEAGVVRNKPVKMDYYEALKKARDSRGGPRGTVGLQIDELEMMKLPKIEILEALADAAGVKVYGKPSANQPRSIESYFTRFPAFRSDGDLHNIYAEIANTGVQRENYLLGITPITKNPTMDCSWDCSFRNMCELHNAGEDWEEYRDSAYHTKEDRYADHNNRKTA